MDLGLGSFSILYEQIILVVFKLISSVSIGVQTNKITTLFDFQYFHNLYLNLFIVHEIGKLWTGLVLLHI